MPIASRWMNSQSSWKRVSVLPLPIYDVEETVIVTDASHCPMWRMGAWAVAIYNARGNWLHGAVHDYAMGNSNEAEMRAVANGLKYAIDQKIVADGARVLICIDAHYVEFKLKGGISKKARRRVRLREENGWQGIEGRDTPPG